MQIYIHKNNQQLGPFTEAEIKAQLASGTVSLQDHVWWQGQANWMPLGQTALATNLPPAPATAFSPPPVPPVMAAMPGAGPHLATAKTSNLAIWSLVCGCLSLVCGIFTAVPAIILGHMSLAEIKKNPALEGRGMALAGTIIGYLMIAIGIIALISIFVLGSLGKQVKETFNQIQAESTNSANQNDSTTNDDSSSNTDSSSSTNSAPAVNP